MFPMRIGQLVPAGSATFTDDFETDSEVWTVNPVRHRHRGPPAQWQRTDPTQNCYSDNRASTTTRRSRVTTTIPAPPPGSAYVTQNGGAPFQLHDIDGGHTTVESAAIDLSTHIDPSVYYARHVYNRDGHPGDGFFFEVSNNGGGTWTVVEAVTDANGISLNPVTNFWTPEGVPPLGPPGGHQ